MLNSVFWLNFSTYELIDDWRPINPQPGSSMASFLQERASPAFQELSDTNRGPLIIITTYIFLICSFLAVVVKIWTRLSTARNVAWTDYLMLAGFVS